MCDVRQRAAGRGGAVLRVHGAVLLLRVPRQRGGGDPGARAARVGLPTVPRVPGRPHHHRRALLSAGLCHPRHQPAPLRHRPRPLRRPRTPPSRHNTHNKHIHAHTHMLLEMVGFPHAALARSAGAAGAAELHEGVRGHLPREGPPHPAHRRPPRSHQRRRYRTRTRHTTHTAHSIALTC
jgi:hypothetical protein